LPGDDEHRRRWRIDHEGDDVGALEVDDAA
jgi:hypothetical protein